MSSGSHEHVKNFRLEKETEEKESQLYGNVGRDLISFAF